MKKYEETVVTINGRDWSAVKMTKEEFEQIKGEKYTPSLIVVGDSVFNNEYTCLCGFDGTCNCISHPTKSWTRYNLKSQEWDEGYYYYK